MQRTIPALLLLFVIWGCVPQPVIVVPGPPSAPAPVPAPAPFPAPAGNADLIISGLSLSPRTPVKGQPVRVQVKLFNRSNTPTGPFTVEWFAGENYPEPGCIWRLSGLGSNARDNLRCSYDGYPSPYSKIVTKAVADSRNEIAERRKGNNTKRLSISVRRPSGGAIQPPPPPVHKQPDLVINELRITPKSPRRGRRVKVHVQVYNKGKRAAGHFRVAWWPGERYASPGCVWDLDRLAARGGRVLKCNYNGYPSRYAKIYTKAEADTRNTVQESRENNNGRRMKIRVRP